MRGLKLASRVYSAAVAILGLYTTEALAQSHESKLWQAQDAISVAQAFRDVCIRTNFDPAQAKAAFTKLGWSGTTLQRPSAAAPYTQWDFSFGQLHVGYRTIGGINSRLFSCSLALRAASAPGHNALRSALETQLGHAFKERAPAYSEFEYAAVLKNKPDEQASIIFVGSRVPIARAGAIELQPGILVTYSFAKGPHAKDAINR